MRFKEYMAQKSAKAPQEKPKEDKRTIVEKVQQSKKIYSKTGGKY